MANSVPPGGPGTINGVLYQMLWSLFRSASLHVSGCTVAEDSGEITRGFIRLEPIGGGGDVQELLENRRIVAQLKARPDQRSWSLREVVEDVLSDLYLAVDPAFPNTEYQLVTEGRMGRWAQAYRFFQSLKDRPAPDGDFLDALDNVSEVQFEGRKGRRRDSDSQRKPFWPAERYTERTLFERIVQEVCERPAIAGRNEPIEAVRRNVWYLLANFTFVGGQTERYLRKEVDSLLLALVGFDTEVATKRDAMLTGLARRAKQGSADVVTTEFLAEYGLDSVPLTDWLTLRDRGRKHLEGELMRRGYDPNEDVREELADEVIAQWTDDIWMLALTGESGQGKSWLAYALSSKLAAEKELAIFIEATGDPDKDLDRVVDVFWRAIKRNDTGPPLDRIADRRRKLLHEHASRWLTVVVDGVPDASEVRALALQPWEDWGVRLVLTCQPDVAKTFEKVSSGRGKLLRVIDFTVAQLQLYLANNFGDEWPSIPADVRGILRRPLLAQLYCEVADGESWQPTNEYELYARYWQRLQEDDQALRPLDVTGLERLAMSVLDGAPYPWAPEQLRRAGLDNPTVCRLARLGFLRRTGAGQFEMWHDRIFNWAVAQGLVAGFRSGEIDAQTFCARLQDLFKGLRTVVGRLLGYVPMDVIWTLADPKADLSELLDQTVKALEDAGWRQQEALYEELLPTVGQRIIPALYRRLAVASEYDDGILARKMIGTLATFDEADLAEHTARLLEGDSPLAQRSSLEILARRPCPQLLNQIWDLHCRMQSRPAEFLRPHESERFLHSESFDALKANVRLNREWLRHAIERADSSREPVHDLAYLLANLEDAADLWQECKSALFTKVSPDKPRCLANNIYTHRDGSEIEWLVEHIESAVDDVGPTALRALARIDADLAVQHLGKLSDQDLVFTRNWCFADLLVRRPEATLSCFHQLMRDHPEPQLLSLAFQGHQNTLDQGSLELLLDELEKILDADLAGKTPPNQAPVWGLCSLLAKVHCLRLLPRFERRRTTSLEEKLTKWLLARGPVKAAWVDHEAESALKVLYKIGGTGLHQGRQLLPRCGESLRPLKRDSVGHQTPRRQDN